MIRKGWGWEEGEEEEREWGDGGTSSRSTLFSSQVLSVSLRPYVLAHQAHLPMGFPRQEFLTGLPFPPPGDLPDPGTEPMSPALAGGFFTTEPLEKPRKRRRGR